MLSEIDNWQVFTLCKEFHKLSLDESGSSSEECGSSSSSSSSSTSLVKPSSYSYGAIPRFLHCFTHSHWSQSIIKQLRAPFIEISRNYMDSSLFQSYDIRMGLGFRFLPGQDEFIINELKLPESFDRLSILSDSLGLSYNCCPISGTEMLPLSSSGTGLRCLVADNITKILVEVVTQYDGRCGRILVLVSLGIGCTAWYTFSPGNSIHHPLVSSLLNPFDTYEPFFNMEYSAPGYSRAGFVERNNSASAVSAFWKEQPFAEITIPASGPVLKAVGLGVMVAFLITVGLVPNVQ